MGHGLFSRIGAAAILFCFLCLSLLAIAPIVFGVPLEEAVRRGKTLLVADASATIEPIRISVAPDIVLTAAQATIAPSPDGLSRSIELARPVITVGATAIGDASGVLPKSDLPAVLTGASSIRLKNGSVRFAGMGPTISDLSDVEAAFVLKDGKVLNFQGKAKYLGQTVTFDVSRSNRSADGETAGRSIAWPLRLSIASPSLDVVADGRLEFSGAWSFTADAEARTADGAKLASWLSSSWAGAASGPALLIKGPMTWSNGVIAFGKSRISIGDQNGVGAASLSIREKRPLIEATLAFPALDITSLLYTQPTQVDADAGQPATWRCLATHFPAALTLDADLRLSVDRLQWRGEPVGKTAFSVSARNGVIHADFSDLDLGLYAGNLQIAIDERTPNAPIVLRGRFQSNNGATLSEKIFGGPIVTGGASGQFEISGHGTTLGDLFDRANGRGYVEARDGRLHLSLPSAQKLLISGSKSATTGWTAISGTTPYQSVTAKLQMRDGAIMVDEGTIRSRAVTAFARGRIGFSPPELDLRLRLETARPDALGSSATEPRGAGPDATAKLPPPSIGTLSIAGTWLAPAMKIIADGSVP